MSNLTAVMTGDDIILIIFWFNYIIQNNDFGLHYDSEIIRINWVLFCMFKAKQCWLGCTPLALQQECFSWSLLLSWGKGVELSNIPDAQTLVKLVCFPASTVLENDRRKYKYRADPKWIFASGVWGFLKCLFHVKLFMQASKLFSRIVSFFVHRLYCS